MQSVLSYFRTPAGPSQTCRFFRVRPPCGSPRLAYHPAYFGSATMIEANPFRHRLETVTSVMLHPSTPAREPTTWLHVPLRLLTQPLLSQLRTLTSPRSVVSFFRSARLLGRPVWRATQRTSDWRLLRSSTVSAVDVMDTIVKMPIVNTQGVCNPHFYWGFCNLWKNKRPSQLATKISRVMHRYFHDSAALEFSTVCIQLVS